MYFDGSFASANPSDQDQSHLFSHSLDSAIPSHDWQPSEHDPLASYLSLGLHAHSLDSPFFDDATLASVAATTDWDFYDPAGADNQQQQQRASQQQPSSMPVEHDFLSSLNEQEQQAILLSDPNFVRQQQLYQEKEMEMHQQQKCQEQKPPAASCSSSTSYPSSTTQSNLSAMLDSTKRPAKASSTNKPNKQQRRSAEEIDHQRRLSELQARFRVNFARKKTPQQRRRSSMDAMRQSVQAAAVSQQQQPQPSSSTGSANGPSPSSQLPQPGTSAPTSSTIPPPPNQQQPQQPSFPSRTMPIQIQRRPNIQSYDAEQRQRQLDEQLENIDFDDITVSELKDMLRQRGKPATGKKAVLVQRLQAERDWRRSMAVAVAQQQRHSFPDPPPSPTTLSLNRSIANMHIGSPPQTHSQQQHAHSLPNTTPTSQQQARRFAPYRSSKPIQDQQQQQQQQQQRVRHKYAPRIPSALATPDHEEEQNPFEQFIMMQQQQQQQGTQQQQQQQTMMMPQDLPMFGSTEMTHPNPASAKQNTVSDLSQVLFNDPLLHW